ncbi:MAG: 1-acyl-sn-glycerol-3-phosphate acyltransferase [Kofleriaceae bacterium]|nr:1-acyl-sn-glycerol-3-phosphate acyltransferase [Kofleriaceae bacterium]
MFGLDIYRATNHAGRGLFNALAELGAARMAPPRDPRDAAHRLAGSLGAVARAHDIAVTVQGDVPRSTALIIANHVSYLDPLAILPMCPAAPVAKGEVESWPIIGSIGAALGVTFVKRAEPYARVRTLRRIHSLLAAGVSVLNFAEGTTSEGDKVRPFFRGSFGIAQRVGVPVVPVVIRYRDPSMAWCNAASFLPHYVKMTAQKRVEVTLTFLPPMQPRAGEPAEDMAARARNAISLNLHRMRLTDAAVCPPLSPSRSDSVLPARRVA